MPGLDLGTALRAARAAGPASLSDLLLRVGQPIGATDVVVYLVDFGQTTLEPMPDRHAHPELAHTEEVTATMAGRAFVDQRPTVASRPDGVRVWVPIVEGSDRTGVLALTVPEATEAALASAEELGLFAGYVIATQARATDLFNLHRRRKALSLAASMQWDLLPPLVLKTDRLSVACLLEPAYDVGGDCFDYSVNDSTFNIALVDAMGHGVGSALISALIVGAYRHDRREGRSLETIHENLDAAVSSHYDDLSFATGLLATVDLKSGVMTWTCAGHPPPMLIRGGRVISELACTPALPWGLGSLSPAASAPVSTASLEPGDSVLFYTDGVVEAQMPNGGERFGAERLADLAGQQASDELRPEEIVRRLIRSVVDHQASELSDDATLALVQWHGPAGTRASG